MSRKFGDIVEGPPGVDPTTDDQYARRGYVTTQDAANLAAAKSYADSGDATVAANAANATNLTSGTVDRARMPSVPSTMRTVSPVSSAIDINASTFGNTIKITMGSSATLNVPTGGAEDQVLQLVVRATAAVNLTLNASLGRLTGIGTVYSIASGKVARLALRRTDITGTAQWIVESIGVQQ